MGCQYFEPCDHGADTFTIAIPKMTFGRNCLHEAGARASVLGMTRVALFTDPYIRDSAYVATVIDSLGRVGLDVAVFDESAELQFKPVDLNFSHFGLFFLCFDPTLKCAKLIFLEDDRSSASDKF